MIEIINLVKFKFQKMHTEKYLIRKWKKWKTIFFVSSLHPVTELTGVRRLINVFFYYFIFTTIRLTTTLIKFYLFLDNIYFFLKTPKFFFLKGLSTYLYVTFNIIRFMWPLIYYVLCDLVEDDAWPR